MTDPSPFIKGSFGGLVVNGSLIPSSNLEFDLGSSTKRWKDVYLSGNTIHLGETTFSRDQDGAISIIDTLATDENGQATAASLQIGSIKSSTGGPINVSTSTLSNMQINAANVTSIVTPTITRIVEQVRVTNVGTAAAMIVNQTGSNNIIAEFQDNNIPTLKIIEDGNGVVIGNELRPDEVVTSTTTTSTYETMVGVQPQSINTEIVASDGSTVELFGRATSTSDDGKSFIVGAPLDSFGSAYIYKWNGATWAETKLTPSDGVAGNNFGTSVAMSADGLTVAVGAPGPETAPGAVYVYKYSGSTWVETKKAADFTNVDVSTYLYDNVWTFQPVTGNNNWRSICWSPELYMFVAVSSTGVGNRVMTSVDGKAWIGRASAADNTWTSVCWASNLNLFVAVGTSGSNNRVMTSPDGRLWTSRVSAADHSWSSVCWSSELSLLVAVSTNGTVMTSPNGINWTLGTSAGVRSWNSVCWAPELSLFVAVASTGTLDVDRVMTSQDGFTWTLQPSTEPSNWTSVCWAPEISLFVAVARAATMISPNGLVWTRYTLNENLQSDNWVSVCWAAELKLFISVSSSKGFQSIMRSSDGFTWTAEYTTLPVKYELSYLRCICWASQLNWFAVVLQTVSAYGNNVLTNSAVYDSINDSYSIGNIWVSQASSFNIKWASMCWSSKLSLFVAIGSLYEEIDSPDTEWLEMFNQIATSTDGIIWTARDLVPRNAWVDVTWSPELEIFVAISSYEYANGNGYIITSIDGLTWTNRALDFVPNGMALRKIIWTPELSQFVILGAGCTLISTDGVNWLGYAPSQTNADWKSICWSPELSLYVAVAWYAEADNYRVITSTNGITWIIRNSPAMDTYYWRSVCWSPYLMQFVAVGTRLNGPIATSVDGISWTSVSQPAIYASSPNNALSAYWGAVLWIPEIKQYVATGGDFTVINSSTNLLGRIMVSPDGTTWTPVVVNPKISCLILCWSPELLRLVVMNHTHPVGGDRRIMTSDVTLLQTTSTISTTGNFYGNALALSKDAATLAVGAPNTKIVSPLKESAGAAYVYKWNGSAWGAQTLLQASDIIDSQKFGVSIAASTNGTSIAVGSELGNGAYVYKLVNSAWTETKAIASEPIVAADGYSTSCAISADGTRFVISAPGKGTNAGAAYIYEWSGSAWVETKLTPTVAGSGFGQSVAMLSDGTSVLVGEAATNSNTGDAYFFMRTNGTWTEGTKLVAPNAEAGDKFGTSVALSSQYAFVGATATDATAADQGSVYVFNYGPAPTPLIASSNVTVTSSVPNGPALIVVGDTLLQGGVTLTGNQTMENLIITNDGTAAALVVNQTGNNSIADFQEAGVSLLKIVDGGNIGVGTTLPAHKLHVVGTTFSTNGFVSYSDARLKTNVKEIESAISLVLQLRGVRYDRIDIPDDERHVGLIAQEVEAVLPEVVKTDASGMKSIAYSDVVAVLVQAVKEQHDQISALKLRAKK